MHFIPKISIGTTGILPAEARVKEMEWLYNVFFEFKYGLKDYEISLGWRMGF
jgi:hypothetical protein